MNWRSHAATLARRALIASVIVAGLFAFAWTGRLGPAGVGGDSPRVALFVNGTLGDKSFFDAAARGLRQGGAELGLRVRVIEGGRDPTRWEPALADLADSGDFDLIVTGTFAMVSLVQRTAGRYPQARFIVFDANVDPAACRCTNVHSMVFRPREAAQLAGALAVSVVAREAVQASALGTQVPRPAIGRGEGASAPTLGGDVTKAPILGAVGGLPIPVVDDFIDGFIAGAKEADPRVRVLRQYANSFGDPATAKDIAKAMVAQGAGLVFQVAGGSGQGVIEAAAETGRWVIGVDADQHLLYRDAYPQRAARILTSVMKHVDVALLQALRRWRAGQLQFGGAESLGLAEGGVSLATSGPGWAALPPADIAALRAMACKFQAFDTAPNIRNAPFICAPLDAVPVERRVLPVAPATQAASDPPAVPAPGGPAR
jgi:basic membrane protein A